MESDPTGPDFLGEAAFAGNVARIRFLLSVGVSPDAADRAGFRALHRCAVSGNVGAAETLLEAGAEVNLTDAFGDTALHYASYCGHADLVGLLLDAGADALRVSADGRTALSTAIEEGHGAVVRLLVDALPQGDDAVGAAADGVRAARVDARATAALTAAATSEPSQSAGVAPTRRPSVGGALSLRSGAAAGSLGGASASAALLPLQQLQQSAPLSHALGVVLLCDAVQAGNLRAVCGLLGGGTGGGASVDVNGVDADGFTALHRAAVTGAVHLVDALLGHGADPNARDAAGSTPLHYAASLGLTGVVHMLLAAGGDPSRRDREGVTAAELAGALGHAATARLLTGAPLRVVAGLDFSSGVILEGELRARRGGDVAFFAWKSRYAVLSRVHRALFLWPGGAASAEGAATRVPLDGIDSAFRRFTVRPREGDSLELAASSGEDAALWVATLRSVMVLCHEDDSATAIHRQLAVAATPRRLDMFSRRPSAPTALRRPSEAQALQPASQASASPPEEPPPAAPAGPAATPPSASGQSPRTAAAATPAVAAAAKSPPPPPPPLLSSKEAAGEGRTQAPARPTTAKLPRVPSDAGGSARRLIAPPGVAVPPSAAAAPAGGGGAGLPRGSTQAAAPPPTARDRAGSGRGAAPGPPPAAASRALRATITLQRLVRGFLARRAVKGWERVVDPADGDIYWYHAVRGVSSWFPPSPGAQGPSGGDAPS